MDALQTVLLNGKPFPVEFGGLPRPVFIQGKKHFIRFSVLPRGVRAGHVRIAGMQGEQPPAKDFPSLSQVESMNSPPVSSPVEQDSESMDALDRAFLLKSGKLICLNMYNKCISLLNTLWFTMCPGTLLGMCKCYISIFLFQNSKNIIYAPHFKIHKTLIKYLIIQAVFLSFSTVFTFLSLLFLFTLPNEKSLKRPSSFHISFKSSFTLPQPTLYFQFNIKINHIGLKVLKFNSLTKLRNKTFQFPELQLNVLSSMIPSAMAPSSGLSYQAEPAVESAPAPAPAVHFPINLTELFERLVQTGIVSNLVETKKTEEEGEEEKKAPEAPTISFDKPETLKMCVIFYIINQNL